jgi:hypothetical protein
VLLRAWFFVLLVLSGCVEEVERDNFDEFDTALFRDWNEVHDCSNAFEEVRWAAIEFAEAHIDEIDAAYRVRMNSRPRLRYVDSENVLDILYSVNIECGDPSESTTWGSALWWRKIDWIVLSDVNSLQEQFLKTDDVCFEPANPFGTRRGVEDVCGQNEQCGCYCLEQAANYRYGILLMALVQLHEAAHIDTMHGHEESKALGFDPVYDYTFAVIDVLKPYVVHDLQEMAGDYGCTDAKDRFDDVWKIRFDVPE